MDPAEPLPGPPQVKLQPGLADQTLRELSPLLAEEGIDLDNVPDMETLNRAMSQAMERHNMMLFTPIGRARELAVATLRLTVEAIAEGDTVLAAAILDQVQPESPDGTVPTTSSCIGLCRGLVDTWLSGRDPYAPADLGRDARLGAGHWTGERAATDILPLARKERAFSSLNTLLGRQGGKNVLYGGALAVASALQGWSRLECTPLDELTHQKIA